VSTQNQPTISSELASSYLRETPWDERAIGIKTFEILDASEDALAAVIATAIPGHYSIKIDPLLSKQTLHQHGFYYCDTLIEPYCSATALIRYKQEGFSLTQTATLSELTAICDGAFSYDRFHRDFNIDSQSADLRYNLWLEDLYRDQNVFDLRYLDELVGFWGFLGNRILLHAIADAHRGKGLAKYFWSLACEKLFQRGATEVSSSISISNVAVLNVYSSLGFKFRNPCEIYHRLIE